MLLQKREVQINLLEIICIYSCEKSLRKKKKKKVQGCCNLYFGKPGIKYLQALLIQVAYQKISITLPAQRVKHSTPPTRQFLYSIFPKTSLFLLNIKTMYRFVKNNENKYEAVDFFSKGCRCQPIKQDSRSTFVSSYLHAFYLLVLRCSAKTYSPLRCFNEFS